MHRIATFISFIMMMFDVVLSNCKSSSLVIKESDDVPIVPKARIEKLTIVMLEHAGVRSGIRAFYFVFFRSLLICILD